MNIYNQIVNIFFSIVLLALSISSTSSSVPSNDCKFEGALSQPIHTILCSVETKRWAILEYSNAMKHIGCLIGQQSRCDATIRVPTKEDIPKSPPPPPAKNKRYQELATTAESVVPQVWWRDGFASDLLLLTHNDSELPRKQYLSNNLAGKRTKNLYQCVSRQQFIRKSLDFTDPSKIDSAKGEKCTAMSEATVRAFLPLWQANSQDLGGNVINKEWVPRNDNNGKLLISALDVLTSFHTGYGGIWTGCFKLINNAECRGALAAASLVVSIHLISDIAGRHKSFTESQFVRGYMLASLGRHVLHGDDSGVGDSRTLTGSWNVMLNDFVALQSAYLKLYMDSFGKAYTEQLDAHIPLSFPPSFKVHSKPQWKHLSHSLEPVYTSLRNWMFTEAGNLIDFGPYYPLAAFPEVREKVLRTNSRRVLIDVGANGFFASPKYLLDSYAPYLPFTHAIMIEPEPHFSASVPPIYMKRYNISFQQIYAEVATGGDTDMLKLLPQFVTKDDFVVLKFDVDPNRFAYGPTMEWGFLFSIMQNPEIAQLVDEVYIELHFHMPSLYWKHYHSNWEGLDCLRYLRNQGAIIHSWP